ncbi:hypothetical protein CEE44_01350 [Candidatus Woesearchaeota archaeon B3_Woes]|nr:MAG: hypothetical protein CEE44_01350 [Candidatus Woesearchaeota archaeon B3_Woes]
MDNIESKIQYCNHELVLSHGFTTPGLARESYPLAKMIQENGVNTILTQVPWARDRLFFHDDETFTEINRRDPRQERDCTNYAWHGGAYLIGDGFMIGDDNGIPSARKETQRVLGVERAIYINILAGIREFGEIPVSGYSEYYASYSNHIDPYYNLGNFKRTLFTWDTSLLVPIGTELAKEFGYELITLPMDEAKYAAIGFIELGDHMVVDCRAEQTMGILEQIGYKILPTPVPLEEHNRRGGSLRCATTEMPPLKHKMKFHPFKEGHLEDGPARHSRFSDIEGHFMIMSRAEFRRLREPLFSSSVYG